MRFTVFILAGLFCLTTGTPITKKGKYIIKFKPGVRQNQFVQYAESFNQGSLIPHVKIKYTYSEKFYNGIAGEFSSAFLEKLQSERNNDIEYIEEDGTVHAIGQQDNPPSWGLSRVASRDLDLSKPYTYYDTAGEGVDVWVVDTGVQYTHSDFGGRAKLAKSFIGEGQSPDGNGHGTHCAGTVGSGTYGVAKKANILGVQVLDSRGSGTYSNVLAGINYVAENVKAGKTVMSMSLGGSKSQAIDDAIVAAINAGVVTVVAAGNESQDACNVSPAGAPGVLAVGASDNTDSKASFSNHGKCVGIFAPGVKITSLWKGADGATNTISGTSMACPHVAGVAALYMAEKNYSNANDVYEDLKKAATSGVLKGIDGNTVNKLLYNVNDAKPTDPKEPPKEPKEPPKEPEEPSDPDDPIKRICKILPFLPFCRGGGGGGGGGDEICQIFPMLCQDSGDFCQAFPDFCNEKKVRKYFANKQ